MRGRLDATSPPSPRALFEPLGPTYERAGALLSLGREAGWRRRLVDRAAPRDGDLYLDVATGTGLVARELRRHADCRVVGIDLTPGMLAAADRGDGIRFVLGRAERLPFADARFDGLTFTYLLRYVDDPGATLRELARVVRPGGRIAMLEFARPRGPLRAAWWLYTRVALPILGSLVSRDWRAIGAFLGGSIDRFYDCYDLRGIDEMWRQAGIEQVWSERIGLGAAVVTSGTVDADASRLRARAGQEVEGREPRREDEEGDPAPTTEERDAPGGEARGRSDAGPTRGNVLTRPSADLKRDVRPPQGHVGSARGAIPAERRPSAPAFYALTPGGWRDYVTLLHPPYTAWHLSYVVLGAALAPAIHFERLAGTLVAFFLALGIGVHALDELNGRPLRTRIPRAVLIGLGALGIGSAVALGILAVPLVGAGLLAFIAIGVALALGYPLEIARSRLHSDLWFALGWGAFPLLVSYWANAGSLSPAALAGGAYALALSYAQRRLSTWVRMLRRRASSVRGEIAFPDGRRDEVDRATLIAAPESALRWLTATSVLVALAALAARLAVGAS